MKGLRPRILLTARDPATSEAMRILAKALFEDGRAEIYLLTQMPATGFLSEVSHIAHHQISVPEVYDKDELKLLAESLLKQIEPNLVLTGISGPDYGIDEAVLAVSPRDGFNPCALQSYWGDINAALQVPAQTYLVLDDFAAQLTKERTGKNTITIGSIRHCGYGALDISELRTDFREHNIPDNSGLVIGFFGQPFAHGHGYYSTIDKFAGSIGKCGTSAQILYRPHPKEAEAQQKSTIDIFARYGIKVIVERGGMLESVLCGVDYVVSAFSTCVYDYQQLLRVSEMPLGVPVYLMFDEKLTAWLQEYSKLDVIPMSDRGMAVVVDDPAGLTDIFDPDLFEKRRSSCWESIKMNFPVNKDMLGQLVELLMTNYNEELIAC